MTPLAKTRRPIALLVPVAVLALAGCSGAAGISFDVPEGWETIDPAELADGATDELEEAADAVGLTPEELQSTMAGADLIVLDDDTEDGEFRNNINVTSPGGELPSADDAAAQLEASGATVGESESVDTDAGEAVTVDYELDAGTGIVQGTVIGVEGDDGLVIITVSTIDAGTTDEIASAVVDSLSAGE